ncbi:hypothetical protein B0H15DRAFT_807334 [Mycena belliarum]|uniref:Uncharacterized protein n=1 Tax=Mycena belliarum TaxID=1033014 RepID=A0AAD6TLA9_9AGAR|nr:hypothetical protein B0H15DRAFT_807334 [Mycena belliae]
MYLLSLYPTVTEESSILPPVAAGIETSAYSGAVPSNFGIIVPTFPHKGRLTAPFRWVVLISNRSIEEVDRLQPCELRTLRVKPESFGREASHRIWRGTARERIEQAREAERGPMAAGCNPVARDGLTRHRGAGNLDRIYYVMYDARYTGVTEPPACSEDMPES